MRKFLLPLLLLLVSGSFVSANAQANRLQAREAEWNNYQLPKTDFSRQSDPDNHFVFRVPADWKQQGALSFTGPHSATLKVVIEKVPEGLPFEEYFAAGLQTVKDLSGESASIITRKTQLQDQDARELVIDALDAEGELLRSTSWLTIHGTQAIIFNFRVPAAHVAEVEPFFKAVVQSVIFPGRDPVLENLKNSIISSATVGPINELQNIVATLNEATSERDSAIARLASLYSPPTDAALDLLADQRPLVRLGAVQAAARSNNPALTRLLWELLDDHEPLVAEAAARGLANSPDVVTKVLDESRGFVNTPTIVRLWPFLPKAKRNELLEQVFKETVVHRPPPPPPKVRPKDGVTVVVGPMKPVQPGKPPVVIATALPGHYANVQIGTLVLMMGVPRDEFKLPFARILASNYDPLLAVALQTALIQQESLPVATLTKLVASSDKQVSRLAALNLALSAGASDIPNIETLIAKNTSRKEVSDELKLTIKKVNFRQQLDSAKTSSERQEIIEKALSDAAIAEFAWTFHCEVTAAGCTANPPVVKRDLAIKPFAENLFPKKVRHYTAIPNPRQTVQNFYRTLHGLQMDSPRAQSNLLLMMGNIRRLIGNELSAPVDAETLIDYTGVDADSPIAMAVWTPRPALDRMGNAQRRAIVLRVKDRARFERTVEKFQRPAGSVTNLADNLGIGTRAIAALPALLPFSVEAILADPATSKSRSRSFLNYSTTGEKEWNGLRIKTIEHAWINSENLVEHAQTHLLYLGDTAILTPDLETLRDLLVNASASGEFLADNPEFRQAIEARGDAVYFSDLNAVFAESDGDDFKVNERGALRFSSSSWENSHQLDFAEREWSKPLLAFNPKELTAARDLLPASTVAYFLAKVDVRAAWSIWLKDAFAKRLAAALPNLSALDLTDEIIAELGPECGVAVLELPNVSDFTGGSVAAFCKLKSNKVADALAAGKLLGASGPATGPTELKVGDQSYFVSVRNGFLVVSNQTKPFAAPDSKTSLSTTRDYARSAAKVPGNVVAFGGYNLEAAIAAASGREPGDEHGKILANVILSLAGAFHSQNFYATATAGTVTAHSSVAMDREGRYGIADFSYLPRGTNITYAVIEASGVRIIDQNRVSRLVLKVRAKAAGPIDNIRDDIKTAEQIVEQKSPTELLLTVAARRPGVDNAIQLPIRNSVLAEYLNTTSISKEVSDKAREIAGNDRDAWSVAQKLADWTHKNLEWKYVVSADPVQTLATREADCTEFSQLFIGMARSLGLPARMVSGLAYNGSSFGGHAWVEVWIGKWIELDPTWGTHYVDATHIRNADDRLLTTAALKLIELEVLDTSRSAAEFQKTPRALAEHLLKALPAGNKPEVEAAIDIATLTDLHMGAGAWAKLNDREREQMWSAYRKVLVEMVVGYGRSDFGKPGMRLLHVEEKGDTAEAICLWSPRDVLLKLRFLRRNEMWQLVEVVQADTGLSLVAEHIRPIIAAIEKVRAGEKPSEIPMSDFIRVLLLLEKDTAKSVGLADELLKARPKDTGLRFLKGIALLGEEKTSGDGEKLLQELSGENYAPAVYRLASYLNHSEEEEQNEAAIELYRRYTRLEPYDPRGFANLGFVCSVAGLDVEAVAAYRKAVELDPNNTDHYQNLIELLVVEERFNEVKPLLAAGEKIQAAEEDLFGSVMLSLRIGEEHKAAEKFAASEPSRMKKSMQANLSLGRIFSDDARYVEAERYFNAAALLDKKSAEPHLGLAVVYRKQSRWLAALRAADKAISIDAQESEGHYQRACALTRLRRISEAMAALTKAVELDPFHASFMADEEDLKPLATLPAFKKLVSETEKPPLEKLQSPPQPQPQF